MKCCSREKHINYFIFILFITIFIIIICFSKICDNGFSTACLCIYLTVCVTQMQWKSHVLHVTTVCVSVHPNGLDICVHPSNQFKSRALWQFAGLNSLAEAPRLSSLGIELATFRVTQTESLPGRSKRSR